MADGPLNHNPSMGHRRLGKTGLLISEIGLGGHGRKDPEERAAILQRAGELGINYLDNATAEECDLYARAIGRNRRNWIIGFSSWPERLTPDCESGLTPARMLANIDARLADYHTDMLDIWRPVAASWGPPVATWGPRGAGVSPALVDSSISHALVDCGVSPASPPLNKGGPGGGDFSRACALGDASSRSLDLAIEVFEKARQQGKVRFLGISGHSPALFRRILSDYPQFSVLFFPYLFHARPAETGSLLALAVEKGVGIIGIKPFAAGAAFGDKPSIWRGITDPRATSLLKIMLQEPRLSAVIPSVLLPGQLEQNVKATYTRDQPLTDSDRRAFRECLETYRWGLEGSFAGYQWLREWETV